MFCLLPATLDVNCTVEYDRDSDELIISCSSDQTITSVLFIVNGGDMQTGAEMYVCMYVCMYVRLVYMFNCCHL